jgi:hypothetical protein
VPAAEGAATEGGEAPAAAAAAPPAAPAGGDVDMDEDALLQQALAMSMQVRPLLWCGYRWRAGAAAWP